MALTELDTFVQKFKQLWKSGQDAHLDLESHNGKAWVGLRLQLGDEPGPPQRTSKLPKTKCSPSRDRRRLRRAAERVNGDEAEQAHGDDAEKASESFDEKNEDTEEALQIIVENSETVEEAENVEKDVVKEENVVNNVEEAENVEKDVEKSEDLEGNLLDIANKKPDVAAARSSDVAEHVTNIVEDATEHTSGSVEDETGHENTAVGTTTEPYKEEPSQISSIVTVYATAVVSNSIMNKVTEKEVRALSSIIQSKDHLLRNIKYIDYRLIRTTQIDYGKYEHSLGVELDVDTTNLWENARSYLYHHLGRDTWTLGDHTNISLIRIHQKR